MPKLLLLWKEKKLLLEHETKIALIPEFIDCYTTVN